MRIFKKLFITTNLVFLLVIFFGFTNIKISANSQSNDYYINESMIEEISNNYEFSENRILVVLDKEYSLIAEEYTVDNFSDINIKSVELLSKGAQSVLENQTKENIKINPDDYRAILCLTLNTSNKKDVLRAINSLIIRDDIQSAEPDVVLYNEVINPNDLYYANNSQWNLNGTAGIDCPQAWNITSGSNDILVGVIDTGIQASHPDLQNRVNTNLSRDFSLASPYIPTTVNDNSGHGTHVAGIIGAQGNNTIGISGVCQNIQLVSLRINPRNDETFASQLILAIDYATEKNIRILNNSNGTDYFSADVSHEEAFITAVRQYPGLFVTSAGNAGRNNDLNNNRFPSNVRLPNLITVGASDVNNRISDFSNWGQNNVDIFAPGGDVSSIANGIISTYPTGLTANVSTGYSSLCGTSMATPHVTGVAALLLSKYPHLSGSALKEIIMDSAEIVLDANSNSVFEGFCVSGGKLNAYNSLNGYKTLSKGTSTNVVENLNDGKGLFGFSQYGSGFVEITMTATKSSGTVTYPQGSFRVLNDDGEVVKKCEMSNFTDEAINKLGQNSFTVFLPESGYYYIDLEYSDENLTALNFMVENIESYGSSINLFNYAENAEFEIAFANNIQSDDFFKTLILKQSSKYEFDIDTTGSVRLVVVKRDSTSAFAGLEVYKNQVITGNTTITLNMDAGTYYIGYFDNLDNSSLSISMTRKVSQYGGSVMVTDPDYGTNAGSQISVAERDTIWYDRSYRGTNILEGFTRLVYFDDDYAPSVSRLDYDWYSSDENVAIVTSYGTVLAKNVSQNTTVKIMAVYKNDMSKVYVKEFTILNDTKTYNSDPLDIEMTLNVSAGKYTSISFGNTPVPINLLQYYYWSSSDYSCASVDNWGRIYCYYSAVGQTVEITGTYLYNSRVRIKITVNIVN